jgi:hypothetical protein
MQLEVKKVNPLETRISKSSDKKHMTPASCGGYLNVCAVADVIIF